ncbi:hypothetical protein LTR56_021890 [Elasticomyces elasticus]|nr:hypothetical protein LTR56_021890 [Elasticomyces elasticus]KAK4908977.1 hypothetical protein LTR49_022201 [Elasticomyces elasticus]
MSSHNPTSSSSNHPNPNDGTSGGDNPTIAPFSPSQQTASTKAGSRSSILVYQKSPLLVATPPQVTRALAYSHPFILPLNHVAGLLSWTTGDPWSSFLLLTTFWFGVLYGDAVVSWAGPLVVVVGLILGMYTRRYSPLSSTLWSGQEKKVKRRRPESEQRKSLDEILETLQTFTGRCDVLLDPFLRLTEFLSTQSSATSATTRPALTSLFLRILALTPFWILLTLPPLHIVTTKRVLLVLGTVGLSWHSRPARVTRTILWRSRSVRNALSLITGLTFAGPLPTAPTTPALITKTKETKAATPGVSANAKPGVRFAFTLYENQRRWLGLGWTASLLAYERQAWTDEHLTETPDLMTFSLPDTESETTKWRWVPGSEWRVEGAERDKVEREKSAKRIGGGGGGDDVGWVYYDNKWRDGRRVDGWDRYTRRRKWVRDAELVEISLEGEEVEGVVTATSSATGMGSDGDEGSVSSTAKRKGWFGGGNGSTTPKKLGREKGKAKDRSDAGSGKAGSLESVRSRDDSGDDVHTPHNARYDREFQWDRSIGEGVMEGLS